MADTQPAAPKRLAPKYLDLICENLKTCGYAVAAMHIQEIRGHIAHLEAERDATIAAKDARIAELERALGIISEMKASTGPAENIRRFWNAIATAKAALSGTTPPADALVEALEGMLSAQEVIIREFGKAVDHLNAECRITRDDYEERTMRVIRASNAEHAARAALAAHKGNDNG